MSKIWIYIKRTLCWIFFNRTIIEKHIDLIVETHKDPQKNIQKIEKNISGSEKKPEEEKIQDLDTVCKDRSSTETNSNPESEESLEETVCR